MELTAAQREAVELPAGAFQILACAGSGKTEVLARRTVKHLLDGVPPEQIVAFTFTEKAAGELRDRIERRAAEADARFRSLPPSSRGLFVGTIHSYCLRLLQEHGGLFELYDPVPEEREWALLQRFARRLGVVGLMSQTWPGTPVSVKRSVEVFRRSTAVVYNERVPRPVLQSRCPEFASVLARYEELLAQMQLLSFDQMIDHACTELAPGGRLRDTFSGRVTQVLVDEYQDLNRAQEEILTRLVEVGADLTVVGDDDQAIYQWRGGDVSLFLGFGTRYQDAERRSLDENQRSRPPIVTVATGFASTIAERVDKLMVPRREDTGPAIELLDADTPEHEADQLAKRIRLLIESGHRPSDIAVLYRSVRTSAKPLIDALRSSGVPVALVGRLSLLDRPEMALLARVFVYWAGGVWTPDEEQDVVTPELLAQSVSALTATDPIRASRIVSELEDMGRRLSSSGIRDLIGTYLDMLRIIGLPTEGRDRKRQEKGLGQLSRLLADFEHAQRRAAPVEMLQTRVLSSSIEEADEDATVLGEVPADGTLRRTGLGLTAGEVFLTRLQVFLEQFASQAAEETPEGATLDQDAVNVMTIHQSKGLEFPIVFVPSLVERRFPSARMGQEEQWYVPADLFDKERYQGREDDERRLLYVAITRARELLVLSWFSSYVRTPARPSRFVTDLAKLQERDCLRTFCECRPSVIARPNGDEPLLDTTFGELLAFSECPYRYHLQYTCGFQPKIALELGFGKLLHHVVAELARHSSASAVPKLPDVDELLTRGFYLPFAGPATQAALYQAARRRLRNYVQRFGDELRRTLQPECRFEVPLNVARVRGRVDLLLRADGGGPNDVELVDFKTSANRPPSEQHQNQLRVYAEAARSLGMNPVQLVIHDLDAHDGGRFVVQDSESDLAAFSNQMRQWVDGIRSGESNPKWDKVRCQSCDFVAICRATSGRVIPA